MANYDLMLEATHDEAAREEFCRSFTNHLETVARPRLRALYEREVRPGLLAARSAREPDRRVIARAMRALPETQAWYALRTASQALSYRRSAEIIERQRDELAVRVRRASRRGLGSLTLDPSLPIPRYIGTRAIHLMPGGYCTERTPDDAAAGALFDRQMTVNRRGSQGELNDDPGASLATWLRERFPDFRPRRILELGCTVGHNLLPFTTIYPEADVHGIDVSAPCLRYAHARANALGVAVHLSQQDAERTAFEAGSFDLVYTRILMHETSHAAVPRIFAECRRLLRPGGLAFHSDAPQFDELDPYTASLRDWDIHCNNEPFMDTWYELPIEALFARAGFAAETCFRGFAPSLHVRAGGVDPRLNRSGGRYFLAGAFVPATERHDRERA